MEVDITDTLLERYLHLLHEYTTLRAELSDLQIEMYQNIARANFSGERGMRYGQDYYDDRMRASRKMHVTMDTTGTTSFHVVDEDQFSMRSSKAATKSTTEIEKGTDLGQSVVDDTQAEKEDSTSANKPTKKDPLKWFGLLTPMSLRHAQTQGTRVVEQVIPKLVTINAEMAQIEIEVRRARKKRMKAEAAAKKHQEGVTSNGIAA
ncbi:hypothetical protein BJ170DRAFT_324695 [Xylariales sp. AK1849]|nr:hypothetical protein BJ170DRAFT_324695 [Xylariales sp. AK1849]